MLFPAPLVHQSNSQENQAFLSALLTIFPMGASFWLGVRRGEMPCPGLPATEWTALLFWWSLSGGPLAHRQIQLLAHRVGSDLWEIHIPIVSIWLIYSLITTFNWFRILAEAGELFICSPQTPPIGLTKGSVLFYSPRGRPQSQGYGGKWGR